MSRANGMPTIQELSNYLKLCKRDIPGPEDFNPDETRGVDVRLQVHAGSWSLHTGDSQYDQDHGGAWGSGFLTPRCNTRDLARELIDEVEGEIAQYESADVLHCSEDC